MKSADAGPHAATNVEWDASTTTGRAAQRRNKIAPARKRWVRNDKERKPRQGRHQRDAGVSPRAHLISSNRMTGWSPTLEGFRTMFRRPSLSLAEIMWRFSFGAAATVLCGLATIAYLDTLPVTGGDLTMLRTGHPLFVAQAIAHIFHGSAPRVAITSVIIISALAILWIVVASLGRVAILGPLLSYIRERAHQVSGAPATTATDFRAQQNTPNHLRSLAGLHFLRVALGLAACASCVGVIVIARSASTKADPRPGLVFLIFLCLAFLIWTLWSSLSWFLAAAPIFVVREGLDTFGALLETATLFRNRPGPVIAVGSWFGLTHLILLIGASTVVGFPLAFAGFVSPVIVLGAVLLLTLTYFALVDALYIGRLAGYIAILEAPPPPVPPPPRPIPTPPDAAQVMTPALAMVDQAETILCDTSSPQGDRSMESSKHDESPTQARKLSEPFQEEEHPRTEN